MGNYHEPFCRGAEAGDSLRLPTNSSSGRCMAERAFPSCASASSTRSSRRDRSEDTA